MNRNRIQANAPSVPDEAAVPRDCTAERKLRKFHHEAAAPIAKPAAACHPRYAPAPITPATLSSNMRLTSRLIRCSASGSLGLRFTDGFNQARDDSEREKYIVEESRVEELVEPETDAPPHQRGHRKKKRKACILRETAVR